MSNGENVFHANLVRNMPRGGILSGLFEAVWQNREGPALFPTIQGVANFTGPRQVPGLIAGLPRPGSGGLLSLG